MILIIDTVCDEKYLALLDRDFLKRKILSNNDDLTNELEQKVKSLISKKIFFIPFSVSSISEENI